MEKQIKEGVVTRSRRLLSQDEQASGDGNKEANQPLQKGSQSSKTKKTRSTHSKTSSTRRKILEAQVNADEEISRLLAQKQQVKLKILEHEKQRILNKLALDEARFEEESEGSNNLNTSEDQIEVLPVEQISQKGKVENWLSNHSDFQYQNSNRQVRKVDNSLNENNYNIRHLLSRQNIDKDLPIFFGDITDWPHFYKQFTSTTDLLGLSDEENICRLRKCLKGNARRAVEGLLISNLSLLENFQFNSSRVEDVVVHNIIHFRSGADVTFHVYGPKKEEKRLRSILNKWADRGYVGNITISEKETSLRSLLSLQSVAINQAGTIRENDEFILSCVARGSPTMTFRWFRDGILINATSTSHKWIKLIKDPHVADQYTALLAVERANSFDEGKFTCQVEDFKLQQCISRDVKISKRPSVKTEPISLTVRRGGNFTIKCISLNENGEKYTYSWTKNRELLPVRTETEKYEILYPSGTILQVVNAEKNVQYSCLIQDGPTSSERVIPVHVVDRKGIHTCSPEVYLRVSWPETAPDTESLLECPKGYFGVVKRYCAFKDGRRPAWDMPNYSECFHRDVQISHEKLQQLQLGYMISSPEAVLQNYLNYLRRNETRKLLPSEGFTILKLAKEVINFIGNAKMSFFAMDIITNTLLTIMDEILVIPLSLTQINEVKMAAQLLNDYLKLVSSEILNVNSTDFYHFSLNTIDVIVVKITNRNYQNGFVQIPTGSKGLSNSWASAKMIIKRDENDKSKNDSKIVTGVLFRNLTKFLPPTAFLRLKDGSELEYEIYSQIMIVNNLPNSSDTHPMIIEFTHEQTNNLNHSNDESWAIKCAVADMNTFTYSWDIYSCRTHSINILTTRCICARPGVFALLLTLLPPTMANENYSMHRFFLIGGCSICTILAFLTTLCLIISFWLTRKSCVMAMKVQCSTAVFLTGLIFMIATTTGPPESYFTMICTTLECCILLGMSCHLSKVLLVFTELTQIPKLMTSKFTVIGILTGVPLITVFGSHLSYETMNIRLESWWMLRGSLAFYIFIIVMTVITILFIFLYVIVLNKLKQLIKIHEKYAKAVKKKMSLLKRSGFLFTGVLLFSISSIIYINFPNKLWSIYQFSLYNVLLGLLLVFCYVLNAEITIQQMFKPKSRKDSEDKFFSFTSVIFSKQDPEEENESGNPKRTNHQQFSLQTIDVPKHNTSEFNSPGTFLQTSTSFSGNEFPFSNPDKSRFQPTLECYTASPQNFNKYSTSGGSCSQSPDILSNKSFAELDLVASSIHGTKQIRSLSHLEPVRHTSIPPKVVITPDDAIAKILESETVILPSELLSNESEYDRLKSDRHEEFVASEITLETLQEETEEEEEEVEECVKEETPCGQNPSTSLNSDSVLKYNKQSVPSLPKLSDEKLDSVFDSISHDLDYLLNRTAGIDENTQTPTLRALSKPPGASIKNKIPEARLNEESSNIPESVTLRTEC